MHHVRSIPGNFISVEFLMENRQTLSFVSDRCLADNKGHSSTTSSFDALKENKKIR